MLRRKTVDSIHLFVCMLETYVRALINNKGYWFREDMNVSPWVDKTQHVFGSPFKTSQTHLQVLSWICHLFSSLELHKPCAWVLSQICSPKLYQLAEKMQVSNVSREDRANCKGIEIILFRCFDFHVFPHLDCGFVSSKYPVSNFSRGDIPWLQTRS